MQKPWKQLPQWAQNPYLLLSLAFLLWMLFFDAENLLTQWKLSRKLSHLKKEKVYYLQQIKKTKKDKQSLNNNKEQLEKFAREKYFMKKKTEDLYIIIDE